MSRSPGTGQSSWCTGYLLDPRVSTTADMTAQAKDLARVDVLTYPSYFSFIAPLLGTRPFWDSADRGEMRPNLRLRHLDDHNRVLRRPRHR